jgi:hypothetical protein
LFLQLYWASLNLTLPDQFSILYPNSFFYQWPTYPRPF